ncbi:MAG: HAD family hydrolase [Candidatus Bathyarchaeota archaeon]|nr:HAD family hydrolase [Candidatus Bathyarchaeota archaeon]
MIKAITFDLWNTLLVEKSYTEKRIAILAEALGAEGQRVNWEALRFAYSASQRKHDELWSKEYCHYPLAERLDDVLNGAGVTLNHASKTHVTERFGGLIREDPPALTEGAADTVSRLSPRFKLGIISDTGITTGNQIRRLFEGLGILHQFTATVFSDETTLCKPRREAFDAALNGLKVAPGEALHVGDLLRTDVAGAKAAGMKGVWLNVR